MSKPLPKFKWFIRFNTDLTKSLDSQGFSFPESTVDASIADWLNWLEGYKFIGPYIDKVYDTSKTFGDRLPVMPEFWPDPNVSRQFMEKDQLDSFFFQACKKLNFDSSELEEAMFLLHIKEQMELPTQLPRMLWIIVAQGRMVRECMEDLYPNYFYQIEDMDMFKNSDTLVGDFLWGETARKVWSEDSNFCVEGLGNHYLSNLGFYPEIIAHKVSKVPQSLWQGSLARYKRLAEFFGKGFLNRMRTIYDRPKRSLAGGPLEDHISLELVWFLQVLGVGRLPVGSALSNIRKFARSMPDEVREEGFMSGRKRFAQYYFRSVSRCIYMLGIFSFLDRTGRDFLDNRRYLCSGYLSYELMHCHAYEAHGLLQEGQALAVMTSQYYWEAMCAKFRDMPVGIQRYASFSLDGLSSKPVGLGISQDVSAPTF